MRKILFLLLNFTIPLLVYSQSSKAVLVNKGTLYVDGPSTTTALYIKGSYRAEGTALLHQSGKVVLTGDLINDVTSGNLFGTRTGSLEFRGSSAQYIRGSADKTTSYINLPQTLIINNQNTSADSVAVVLDALMGATVRNITLSRGRLILDSKPNGARQSDVAHLLVETGGGITYKRTGDKHEQGIVQVNLALGNNCNEKRLMGFTPPFNTIYADYFMFNFLSAPSNKGLFGDTGMLITDPRQQLKPGKGYIVGQGILPEGHDYYSQDLDPQFAAAAYAERAKEKISFARSFAPSTLCQFVNDNTTLADRFEGEGLCTAEIKVQATKGFNYFGNPYTVPLDMSGFVQEISTADDWGVTRKSNGTGDVRSSFYVMSQGTGEHYPENNYHRFKFNVSYLIGQRVGGTLTYDGGTNSLLIAPMQMFIVGRDADGAKEMKIPLSARKHGQARFLRSAPADDAVTDELLIETRDSKGGGYDRLCVVFRDNATTISNDPYDAGKIFNPSGGVNQIYTKSLDDKSMTTNVVPPSVESMVMYLEPADEEQEVNLEAYRLQSLSTIKQVVLEDTKTGVKTNLLQNPAYSFMAAPGDKADRFILHFDTRSATGIEDEQQDGDTKTAIYYHAGIINIQGLTRNHIGAGVSVFDLSGKQVFEHRISQAPAEQIHTQLPKGTYVVRLTAEKSTLTEKILVK